MISRRKILRMMVPSIWNAFLHMRCCLCVSENSENLLQGKMEKNFTLKIQLALHISMFQLKVNKVSLDTSVNARLLVHSNMFRKL